MELEKLLSLKTLIESRDGMLLIRYLGDYVTQEACKNIEALEVKGMCRLLQKIKEISEEFIKKRGN